MTNSNNSSNYQLQLLPNPTLSSNKKPFKNIKSKRKLPRDQAILPSDQNLSIITINNNIIPSTPSWLTLKLNALTLILKSRSVSHSKLKLFKSYLKNLMTMMKRKSSKRLLSETKAPKNLNILHSTLRLTLLMKKPSHVIIFVSFNFLSQLLDDNQTHQSSYKYTQQADTFGDDNTLDAPLLGKSKNLSKKFSTKKFSR